MKINMSDPKVLGNFLATAIKIAPARRYAFIPWDHGMGYLGLLSDDDPGEGIARKGLMSMKSFSQTVQAATKLLPHGKFDLIVYYMCLMGQMDVMAETQKFADFAVASPPSLPMLGLNFREALKLFNAESSTREVAINLVKSSIESMEKESFLNAALSAYDLSVMPKVVSALKNLTDDLEQIAGKYCAEITKTLFFATHLQSLENDISSKNASSWSVRLDDWLHKLKMEIPDLKKDNIEVAEKALQELVIATGATSGAEDAIGIGMYLPVFRDSMNSAYSAMEFGRLSGVGNFLNRLYDNRSKLNTKMPVIENIEIGTVKVKNGKDGQSNEDFELTRSDVITPLKRNVIRYNIHGSNILFSQIMQIEIENGKRIVNHIHMVTNNRTERNKLQEEKTNGFFSSISPNYKNGDNLMMLEIPAVKYKVYYKGKLHDVTVENNALSSKTYENLSYIYALYSDPTLNGQVLKVKLAFYNTSKLLYQMTAYGDTTGRSFVVQLPPRAGGTLRLGTYVFDQNNNLTIEYGENITLDNRSYLVLLLDLLKNNTEIENIINVSTFDDQKVKAKSPRVKVVHNEHQDRLIENTYKNWKNNVIGRYAMVEFVASDNQVLALPNSRILSLQNISLANTWILSDSNDEEIGRGNFNVFEVGVPQLVLHLPNKKNYLVGQTVESWYAFLSGSGNDRIWYLVGEGDGVRSMLVPLEQYKPENLEGVWRSDSELWRFYDGKVEYMRLKEKLVAKGTYTTRNDLIKMQNMPFDEYAYYFDRANNQLTLVSSEQKRVSVLKKVSDTVSNVTDNNVNTTDNSDYTADKPVDVPNHNSMQVPLVGSWISGSDTGNARMTIVSFPGTPFFNLHLVSKGQGTTICFFSIVNNSLYATYLDGSKGIIGFNMTDENTLTLYFPNMPPISFTRQN